MPVQASIYKRVLSISEDYLGPAAQRFLSRLIMNHLGKPANEITCADLPRLVDWIKLATTVITDDEHVVTDYINRLEQLSNDKQASKRSQPSNQHATAS